MILNSKKSGKRLPTLTNPGVASDLVSGKQLINQDGEIVTGTIMEYATGNFVLSDGTIFQGGTGSGNDYIPTIGIKATIPYDLLGRMGKEGSVSTPASNFGNATAADVAAGKTFTSAAGVNVSGTAKALGSLVTVQSVVDHGNRYVMQMALSGSGGIYPFSNVGVNSVQFTCRVGEYITLIGSSNFTGYDSGDFTLITYLNVGNFTVALYRCDGTDASYIGFRT